MTRNDSSRFSELPGVDIQRSKFARNSQHKTTLNTGDLVPIYVDEILPGDTVSMDMAACMRMSTPIFPVMDNAYCDFYFFFVPDRLLWEHWREFNGENRTTHWEQPVEYEIPQLTAPSGGWSAGTIADYMGIPIGVDGLSVSALPFRAYGLIWNEWFRDQNLKDPCMVNLDDATQAGSNGSDYVSDVQLGGMPAKAAKPHDYFTSCLPEPQKGPDVLVPLGDSALVYADSAHRHEIDVHDANLTWSVLQSTDTWEKVEGSDKYAMGVSAAGTESAAAGFTGTHQVTPDNLYADLSRATGATVNQLRQAFAIQRLYERDARGGTRYTEVLRAHFGVESPDGRQQRPEYLGGMTMPIAMDQVVQTSGTTDTSPQGNTAAYSLSTFSDSVFTKSFTEHGYLLGLCCVRTQHTYQQGIERFWSRKKRFDFYWPALANIGEQPVLNKEIYAQGNYEDDEAFGYQEAWADYRYKPSRVSCEFRSAYAQTLDSWHYADDYEKLPALSSEWIDETPVNVDRTLAVSNSLSHQFLCDFFFRCDMVRPMPVYSVPGLLDHN